MYTTEYIKPCYEPRPRELFEHNLAFAQGEKEKEPSLIVLVKHLVSAQDTNYLGPVTLSKCEKILQE